MRQTTRFARRTESLHCNGTPVSLVCVSGGGGGVCVCVYVFVCVECVCL
jgi:hypothetical protein